MKYHCIRGDVEGEVGQKEEKATQTVYDNWTLSVKIETIIMKRSVHPSISPTNSYGNMAMEVILQSSQNSKYFIGLYPQEFWALYEWLGPAKFKLNYWNSKTKDPKFKIFIKKNTGSSTQNSKFSSCK